MEILNLGGANDESAQLPSKKRLKVAKAAIGIGGLAALTGLGSTLAATITLNSDAPVEFGQGVAQTAACDADGFAITPVSYYDANLSTFRLDYVQVTGLNLVPVGSDFSTATGTGSSISYSQYSDITAIAAHPGQYYDASAISNATLSPKGDGWVNTCDQVVLDFKAYTDDIKYVGYTLDGYTAIDTGTSLPNTTSSPLFWRVNNYNITHPSGLGGGQHNSDIAIIFDATSGASNSGTLDNNYDDVSTIEYTTPNLNGTPNVYTDNSTFRFYTYDGHASGEANSNNWRDPSAGAISKITVESMKYFPSNYSQASNGVYGTGGYLGVNPN